MKDLMKLDRQICHQIFKSGSFRSHPKQKAESDYQAYQIDKSREIAKINDPIYAVKRKR